MLLSWITCEGLLPADRLPGPQFVDGAEGVLEIIASNAEQMAKASEAVTDLITVPQQGTVYRQASAPPPALRLFQAAAQRVQTFKAAQTVFARLARACRLHYGAQRCMPVCPTLHRCRRSRSCAWRSLA